MVKSIVDEMFNYIDPSRVLDKSEFADEAMTISTYDGVEQQLLAEFLGLTE